MKILHVIPSLSPLRGGPSVTVRTLAAGLTHAGHTVHVVATDDDGPGRAALPLGSPSAVEGVTYRYFARQTRFYTASWPMARWLNRHICDYDIVHTHALFSFAPLAAAAIAARSGVPYLVRPLGTLNRWGMQRRRPLLKQMSFALCERRMLTNAAAVHYTSEQERCEAVESGACGRPVVIPNPVAIDPKVVARYRGRLRARYPELAGRTIVLFLSRLDPKKGLDLLIPAFAAARASHPDLALVVAGTGDAAFVDSLRAEVARFGISNGVVWAGQLDGEMRMAAFADADLFALPSYSENFGNAAVEAMACSIPVVLSDQVGVQQEVAEVGAGLIVPCQVAPLTAALLRLAAEPALRATMGARARSLVRKRFTPQAVATQLIGLYEQILGVGPALYDTARPADSLAQRL